MPTWLNVIFKLVTPIATLVIAGIVALISWFQWRISKDKLRLDLFNRRFDIYQRVLDYHRQLVQWDDKPEQIALTMPFVKAVRESRFIFPKDSGVFRLLEEFQQQTHWITSFAASRNALQGMPKELMELGQKRLDSVNWILASMKTLEDKMEPYMSFEKL